MSLKSSLLSSLLLALSAALLIPSTMAQTFSLAQTFTGNASKIATDDNYVIVGHMEVLSVWNSTLDGGTKIRDIVTGYTEPIVAMDAWDGIVYAVTSNAPRSIRAWNYITGVERWRAPAVGNSHDDVVTDLVVGTNSLCLYTSSMDGTIKIWRTSDAQLHTVQNPIGPSGFFAPVHKLFLDRTRNPTRIYAIYGRHVAADGVGRATETLPDHDFEGILTSTNMPSSRYLGAWETSMGDTVYFSTGNVVLNVPPSGKNVVTMNNLPGSSVKPFIRQTASLVPGHSYRLQFFYARYSTRPLAPVNTFTVCGKPVDVQLFSPASNPFIRATSSIFVATGKFCDVEFSASGCGGLCSIVIDFVELVMVQRRANFDNMDVMPLSNGSFEDIEETSTNVTFTGSFGAWSKTAGSGVVGIAFVGSANCYNLPSTGGLYALWMETVTNSDTTVSQSVSLAPGAAYMVRWHYAMRQVNGTSTANPVSSALNVSLCGTVVAGGFTAPSLLFEEASSTIFTPVGTTNITCELAFIILRGASTLRSLLIDEVELVRVRNPNLVPSGSFEGLTTTTTSWVVYPGIFGDWNSSGHSSGRIAVARIPSTECDNIVSLASPYVLWMQSSTSAPETSVSVAINSLVSGSTYRVRWVFARRKHASTTFASPTLSVFVFGNTIASGRSPVSDVFVADESSDFVASNSTTTLTLAVSINVGVLHMLIDDVEVVLVKAVAIAGSPPFVREFTIPSISSITYVRNYSLPTSWLATLSAETVANMAVLSAASGFLYIGMSLSVAGSSCHVLVYSIADGTFFGSHSVSCTGGSVRCMIVRSGQLFVGHIGAVSHVTLAGDSLVRVLDWGVVSTTIVDMATSNQYFIASGNDTSALKWNVPELFPTTTTTTTSTRTTTTTTRTTTSTTTTTRTTSTTTTTSTTSKTTTTSIAGNNTDGSPNPALGFGLSRIITLSAVSVASVFLVIAIVFAVVSHCRNKGHKYNQLHSKITGHPFINENNPLFVGEIPMYNPNARIVYSRSVGGFGLNGYPPIASPGRGRRPSREADDVRQFTQGNFTDQHRTHDPSVRSPPNLYYND